MVKPIASRARRRSRRAAAARPGRGRRAACAAAACRRNARDAPAPAPAGNRASTVSKRSRRKALPLPGRTSTRVSPMPATAASIAASAVLTDSRGADRPPRSRCRLREDPALGRHQIVEGDAVMAGELGRMPRPAARREIGRACADDPADRPDPQARRGCCPATRRSARRGRHGLRRG